MTSANISRWLVPALAIAAVALLVTACGGGGQGKETVTPTRLPVTNTPEVSVPVPPRPGDFDDYPDAIAAYLSEAGEAALGSPCLADLLAAWQMPTGRQQQLAPVGPPSRDRCVPGSTDADPDDEVIVALSATPPDLPSGHEVLTNLIVIDRSEAGYRVAFESAVAQPRAIRPVPDAIVTAGDLNDDGAGELVYARFDCGAHTCTWHIHSVTGDGTTYRRLTPEDGLLMATAEIRVQDTDGDGTKEIVLHGGVIQSVGAGPQRQRTEVYAWDGQQYSLTSVEYDPSDLRYFKVRDADDAFANEDYLEAARLYQEAIDDPYLKEVEYFGSRDELMAYSRFRLGLSYLKLGNTRAASGQIEEAIADYPVSLMGEAAVVFRNAIELTRVGHSEDLSAGCRAVADFARQNLDRFREVWNYGYANPLPAPEEVCLF